MLAEPLTKLTKKDTPFVWGKEQHDTQEAIIQLITHAPILARPDPSRQFELEADASQISTGAILYQRDLSRLTSLYARRMGVTMKKRMKM